MTDAVNRTVPSPSLSGTRTRFSHRTLRSPTSTNTDGTSKKTSIIGTGKHNTPSPPLPTVHAPPPPLGFSETDSSQWGPFRVEWLSVCYWWCQLQLKWQLHAGYFIKRFSFQSEKRFNWMLFLWLACFQISLGVPQMFLKTMVDLCSFPSCYLYYQANEPSGLNSNTHTTSEHCPLSRWTWNFFRYQ